MTEGAMVWYVQPISEYDGSADRLAYAAKELGVTVISSPYRPFDAMNWNLLPTHAPALAFGSINMLRSAQHSKRNIFPLAWCDWKVLRCSHYFAYWRQY